MEERYAGDAEKIKIEKGKMKIFKYIGETSRSVKERGFEHHNDIDQLKTSSHMLRHLLEMHDGEDKN